LWFLKLRNPKSKIRNALGFREYLKIKKGGLLLETKITKIKKWVLKAILPLFLACLYLFPLSKQEVRATSYNVVLIVSDEHNPFVSSVYGYPGISTPVMSWMAQNGTVYQNAYSPSPLCMPMRSALMSGLRVNENQCYSNCNLNLYPSFPSYGKILKDQGIYTAYIGKTDVYDKGANLGFSEMLKAGDRDVPGDTLIRRNPLDIRTDGADRAGDWGVKATAFDGDLDKIDRAVTWLQNTASGLSQPWVLVVNLDNPHFPQYATQAFWDMYPNGGDLPQYGGDQPSGNHPYALDLRAHFECDQFGDTNTRGLRRGYLADVSFVDQQLGRVRDILQQTGLAANTNFIYSADHGEMRGKFGMWWKCSLYEDSVRVPCLAYGPGFISGAVVATPVDSHDIRAAIFRAVGTTQPTGWHGTPLQDIPVNDPQRVVFSEYHGHGTRAGAFMIRKGNWKLIYNLAAPHQLFDLSLDPNELTNVYSQNPAKAAELEAELRNICSPETENTRAFAFQDAQIVKIDRAAITGKYTYAPYITNIKLENGTVLSSETELFKDDFEDGDQSGWTVFNGTWTVVQDTASNKTLKSNDSANTGKIYRGQSAWTDYTVESKIKISSWSGSSGRIGLMGRYADNNNHYFMYLDNTNQITIAKKVGGTVSTLATSVAQIITIPDKWHIYKMVLKGGNIKAYVDDTMVVETSDSSLTAGCAGCYTQSQIALFDNVTAQSFAESNNAPPNTQKIIVTFSEHMKTSTLTSGNIQVKIGGTPVAYSGVYGGQSKEYTMTFSPSLANGTTFNITVNSNVQNYTGQAADVPYNLTFTTAVDLTTPTPTPLFTATPTVVPTATPDSSLKGWWKFDETSGTIASDSSGNGKDGTVYGATWTTAGKSNGALDFDGVDDYVGLPNIVNPSATNFTVVAWVKLDVSAGSNSQIILQQEGTTGRSWLYRRSSDGKLATFLGNVATLSSGTITTGSWYHVAVVNNGGAVQLYFNGQPDGSASRTLESATGNMRVGRHKTPDTVNEEWDGIIDQVRIYNRALTAAEVLGLYDSGS
jgi:choline-sulfatase